MSKTTSGEPPATATTRSGSAHRRRDRLADGLDGGRAIPTLSRLARPERRMPIGRGAPRTLNEHHLLVERATDRTD